MGQSKFWKGVTNVLFPPSIGMGNDRAVDEAYQNQAEAGQNAQGMMQQQFDYLGDLNKPLINVGDQQLRTLQQGVDSGRFLPSESVFSGYQITPPQNYTAPDQYSYNKDEPGGFTGPDAVQYDQTKAPEFAGAPDAVQYDQTRQPTLADQRNFSFNGNQRPGQYQFNPYQYQGQQTPGQVGYSQNQFSPYQQSEQRPDFYRAPDISDGDYYDPNQQQFEIGSDPVYQRRIQEANKATEASAAARGMQLSGSTLKALQENASGIASEEGAAAYGRYADQQDRLQGSMNYRNEDEYRRALNMAGIRGAEAEQEISQWNADRGFGQASSTENLYSALATQGQNYGQYSGNRGMDLSEYQTNLGGNQWGYGTNMGQYNTDRGFSFDVNQAGAADDLARFGAQSGQFNQNLQNQLQSQGQAWNQAYQPYTNNLAQYNQNLQNQLQTQGQAWNQAYDPYLTNLGQYNTDRGFDYGTYGDYNANQMAGMAYNNDINRQFNTDWYGQLSDQYNRMGDRGTMNYGMIGDLANLGVTGRQNMGQAAGDYWGSMADIGIGTSNAYAAATAAKNSNNGILDTLLGK